VSGSAAQDLEIVYLANEGVWLKSGRVEVLVDPLFSEDFDTYFTVPADEQLKIIVGNPPYDGIDYLVISHYHADHFDPGLVRDFLMNHPGTILLASTQVCNAVRRMDDKNDLDHRIRPISAVRNGPEEQVNFGDVQFRFHWIQHTGERNRDVENLVSTIRLNGRTIVHFGDAMTDPDLYEYWSPPEEGVELALVPVWFLLGDEGKALLEDKVDPRHLAAIHVPRIFNHWVPEIREDYPEARLMTTFGQTIRIE
jgi:L-ascorbate metabolism protein UlaG (beta-lactamase superfamily)